MKFLKSAFSEGLTILLKEISLIIFVGLFFHLGPPKSPKIESSSSFKVEKKSLQLWSIVFGLFLYLKKSSATYGAFALFKKLSFINYILIYVNTIKNNNGIVI